MLWVPKTTSTQGARLTMVSRSFWARQPPTAICRSGFAVFAGPELAEVAVELVVGVLAHRAGVEDDDVRDGGALGGRDAREVDVAGGLEQPGEALGVVHVHLAPVGAHVVGLRGSHGAPKGTSRSRPERNPSPGVSTGGPLSEGAGRVEASAATPAPPTKEPSCPTSVAFYEAALAPLGITTLIPVPADEAADQKAMHAFGVRPKPFFWLVAGEPVRYDADTHVAFTAPDRATVDAFHGATGSD